MGRPKTNSGLVAQRAIRRGEFIVSQLACDGADFVSMDDTHAYIWHKEQLVNLWDHQDLIRFLTGHGYMTKRTENRMIIVAAVIMNGVKRCE